MERTGRKEKRYGLIGRNIAYSFSMGHFTEKFEKLGLSDHSYENFDLADISEFEKLVRDSDIKGLNVTIPYKEEIIPYLDDIDPNAAQIGAVNTIKFTQRGTIGYNTDVYGFGESLKPLLRAHHKKALILGTGGASKAIAHVLSELGIIFSHVSRNAAKSPLTYDDLKRNVIEDHQLIINCTPLGTHPRVEDKPNIPYNYLGEQHLLYDLIYNPKNTSFLNEGKQKNAVIKNGQQMLELQAEKAWQIWNS